MKKIKEINKSSSFKRLTEEQISKIKGGLRQAGAASCTTGSSNGCESTAFFMSKKIFLLFAILVFFLKIGFAQINVQLQNGLEVDTTRNPNKGKVFRLWSNYLNSKPDSLYSNPFWNEKEKKEFKCFDLLKSGGYLSPSLYYLADQNLVLSIEQQGENFKIRSILYSIDKNKLYSYSIIYVMAIPDGNGAFRLANYLPFHNANWFERNVGKIRYIYQPQHAFDIKKAQKANNYLLFVEKQFDIKLPEKVFYFIAPNCDELQRMQGFDYVLNMGTLPTCGFADKFNPIIYATSVEGEDHEHELTHLLNNFFPKAHPVLLEGIAVLQGDSHMGKPLSYHIKIAQEFLKKNPDIDFTNIEKLYSYHLGDDTELVYVIAAVITQMITDKGGIALFKKALNNTADDEKLLAFLTNNLSIKRTELNKAIVNKINNYKK